MTTEIHIDSRELAHFDEYEGEFNDIHMPGPTCAIPVYVPTMDECDEEWEQLFCDDLLALGFNPGQKIWIEIDY